MSSEGRKSLSEALATAASRNANRTPSCSPVPQPDSMAWQCQILHNRRPDKEIYKLRRSIGDPCYWNTEALRYL
ncbi:hypothetical protein Micbo1qcDRAFT_170084, partial [Microdochium bolleyi]